MALDLNNCGNAAAPIRQPVVAGMFYPAEADALREMVGRYLEQGRRNLAARKIKGIAAGARWPKAIIAPHAGYVYSGPVAGTAYAAVESARGTVRRVVMIGPSHRVAFNGVAACGARAFGSPLGEVEVDLAAMEQLRVLPFFSVLDKAHEAEHSLEVQLPFIQMTLGDIALVPLVAGQASAGQCAAALDLLWGGRETLIIVSSDLSHYHDYATARRLDEKTSAAVESLAGEAIACDAACGRSAIQGLLETARRRGMTARTLDLRNSGDTAGPREQVVGYGAYELIEPSSAHDQNTDARKNVDAGALIDGCAKDSQDANSADKVRGPEAIARRDGPLDAEDRRMLLKVARQAIEHHLSRRYALPVNENEFSPALRRIRATFVTLHLAGELRGCIGVLEAQRPLVVDAARNAQAAAFSDPRFDPVSIAEAARLEIDISILSLPEPMPVSSEADLLRQIRPGVDGILLEEPPPRDGYYTMGRRGTFLPSVWETLPDPRQFLIHLKRKAGLPDDYWSPTIKVWRYTTEYVKE